ncbi:MAG: hypothetical protein IH989_07035 [Planctomycetes bacterium]|nr:hypothetical protein [Planctomycetota bacterium]
MLRVDRSRKELQKLDQPTLPEVGWKEREDLQRMIRNSPDAFFAEMGEQLMLVGEEIRPAEFVDDRIDLLAIDKEGASVVIELKRGTNKLQLLQGLAYAAMVSKWENSRFLAERQRLTGGSAEDVESEVEGFLVEDTDELNQSQRIVLMAEDFDFEVLIAAEWLTESYAMDIRCYRLRISTDGSNEFLSCTCIYPPPEITQHVRRRGSRREGASKMKWSDWEEALSTVKNEAVADFFQRELAAGRDSYLRKRILHFQVKGRRRLWVAARRNAAYVWQGHRFDGDETLWTEKIGEHIKVEPVKRDSCLRFFLSSGDDFTRFAEIVEQDLPKVEFLRRGDVPETQEDNEEP